MLTRKQLKAAMHAREKFEAEMSAMISAIISNDIHLLKKVCAELPSDCCDPINFRRPMHIAVERSSAIAIRCLIEAGFSVNQPDVLGFTPLHSAAYGANQKPIGAQIACIQALIEAGADLDDDTLHVTPRMILSRHRRDVPELSQVLEVSADVNQRV